MSEPARPPSPLWDPMPGDRSELRGGEGAVEGKMSENGREMENFI